MLELNFSPFPEIKTSRLLLRRIVMEDAPEILVFRSHEKIMEYIDREPAKTIEDAQKFCAIIEEALVNNEGISWGIALLNDPLKLIGQIGFWRIERENYRGEIGYLLHHDHWGKGLISEAVQAAIAYAFGSMKLHSIKANINPMNAASAAVLEKNGFEKEAYFKEDYYFRGKFLDSVIYSKLNK